MRTGDPKVAELLTSNWQFLAAPRTANSTLKVLPASGPVSYQSRREGALSGDWYSGDLTARWAVAPVGIGPAVAHRTAAVDTGAEVQAPGMEWPVAGTPGHTVDRAADTAGSIVDKAAVGAGKAAGRGGVLAYLQHMVPAILNQ